MTIQWFPGHMTRARRQIEAKLGLIDLAIELLDARLPLSSRNPMIGDILKDKPRLILLNKSDLADPEVTKRWIEYFREEGHLAIETDTPGGRGVKDISVYAKQLLKEKIDRQIAKGMNPRAIRGLIVGIPNVGKSTLINKLAGKSIAETGDRPGVTKGQQWIKIGKEMELLDTPGILWPKFDDQNVGMKLAVTGAIKEDVLNVEEVTFFAIKYCAEHYWDRLSERYALGERPTVFDDPDEIVQIMEEIGRKRGCIMSGGRVDLTKASVLFLRDLRSGKLGRFSLEEPF